MCVVCLCLCVCARATAWVEMVLLLGKGGDCVWPLRLADVEPNTTIVAPSQVHLAPTADADGMQVTWSTALPVGQAQVQVREAGQQQTALYVGTSNLFTDNGTRHTTQYMHRVNLTALRYATQYEYQVGHAPAATGENSGAASWSQWYSFTTFGGEPGNWSTPRFTVYGDFGLQNPRAFPDLLRDVSAHATDVIVHTGDFAYDMYADNATFGNAWLNFVEPVYAHVPVLTCIGNHEGIYDALNYRQRFTMPLHNQTQNLFYSVDIGNTHWIAYSTEVYFVYEAMTDHGGVHRNFGPYPKVAQAQLEFIEADLKALDRSVTPWVFAFGHRPMVSGTPRRSFTLCV